MRKPKLSSIRRSLPKGALGASLVLVAMFNGGTASTLSTSAAFTRASFPDAGAPGGTEAGAITCGATANDPLASQNAPTLVPSAFPRRYAEIAGESVSNTAAGPAVITLTMCGPQPAWPDTANNSGDGGVSIGVFWDYHGAIATAPQVISYDAHGDRVWDGPYSPETGFHGSTNPDHGGFKAGVVANFQVGQAGAGPNDTVFTWLNPDGSSSSLDNINNKLTGITATWVGTTITFTISHDITWLSLDLVQRENIIESFGVNLATNVVATASVLVPVGVPTSVAPRGECVPDVAPPATSNFCFGTLGSNSALVDTFPGDQYCPAPQACFGDGQGYDYGLATGIPAGAQAQPGPGVTFIAPFVSSHTYNSCLTAESWPSLTEGQSINTPNAASNNPAEQDTGALYFDLSQIPVVGVTVAGLICDLIGSLVSHNPEIESYGPVDNDYILGAEVAGSQVLGGPHVSAPYHAFNRFEASSVSF